MFNFLKRLLLFSAALALPAVLNAQSQDQAPNQNNNQSVQTRPQTRQRRGAWSRRGAHGRSMAALAQKLNLDDQQKEQFQHIRRQMMEQARSVRNDSALNDQQKREKLQELRKQAHRQMFSLLTPEQKDRLRQMREEHRKQVESNKASGAAQGAEKPASPDDDDPFAGMTSDDDDGTGNGS